MATIAYIWKQKNVLNRLDLDILLCHSIKQAKEFLYTHPEYKLSLVERLRLGYFFWLYKRGYSVAAITHHKEFYGLDFYVNKHTLIPRPETELLVEETLKSLTATSYKLTQTILIDVGTGSGCIPIAIAKHLNCHPERAPARLWREGSRSQSQLDSSVGSLPQNDNLKIYATDISNAALRVARKNARTHNVSINFIHGNLLEPVLSNHQILDTKYQILITANLPYLTQAQFDSEPSIQREPRSALVAGNNGLVLYEQLLSQLASLISNIKYPIFIFLEIDPSQTEPIKLLIQKYLSNAQIEIKPDLARRDRVVKIILT